MLTIAITNVSFSPVITLLFCYCRRHHHLETLDGSTTSFGASVAFFLGFYGALQVCFTLPYNIFH